MDGNDRIGARSGVNQIGVRAHNERLILSLIRRSGGLPGDGRAGKGGCRGQP